jgi:hypothetical protein
MGTVYIPNRLVQRQRCRFVFGRCLVPISAGTWAVLTEVFHGFPHSLQANVKIVPQVTTATFQVLSNSAFIIRPFNAM